MVVNKLRMNADSRQFTRRVLRNFPEADWNPGACVVEWCVGMNHPTTGMFPETCHIASDAYPERLRLLGDARRIRSGAIRKYSKRLDIRTYLRHPEYQIPDSNPDVTCTSETFQNHSEEFWTSGILPNGFGL